MKTPKPPKPPKTGYDPIIACLKRGETAERWQDRDVRECRDVVVLLQDILLELRR